LAAQSHRAWVSDPDTPWGELSPQAKTAWMKHMKTIIGYIGEPTKEELQEIINRGVGFSA
jgi:hypothetical protein